ncbi:MAG: glycosyltransferase family 4 protein [Bacteroidetes bacterium]|nr:glycosyltransferase family 4 protein [Bacteroidota bacterium]
MKKIIWQTKTHLVSDSFRNHQLSSVANGGNAYDFYSAESLCGKYDIEMSDAALLQAGESTLSYWRRMRRDVPLADAIICEPYPIVFGRRIAGIKYAGMIHHIDDVLGKSSVKHSWYFGRLKRRLSKLDMVITVSSFWKSYLENIGCKSVRVIYNSFDTDLYRVEPEIVSNFKSKHGIPTDRPMVYIGNASRQKGVYEVYEKLKDEPYFLVMSGPQNHAPDLPVKYLKIDHREYLALLTASAAVITNSKMIEGWNRIAHEALLCGTPVVGSGVGGMRELLEGAGQLIASNDSELPAAVKELIQNRTTYSASGKKFVSKFDMHYFRQSWLTAMEELMERK